MMTITVPLRAPLNHTRTRITFLLPLQNCLPMPVTIHCPNRTLTYLGDESSGAINLLFPTSEHKSSYPALIVERLIHGILHDDPILCTELSCLRSSSSSSVRSLQNYVGCIRELDFCDARCIDNFPAARKWVTDLLNLEQWVNEFKVSVASSFTKTNMAKTATKITIKFPFSAHVGGQLSSTIKRKYDEDKVDKADHIVIPQHAYQFVYRCFQDSLPGKKEITSARDNQLFEFSFLKDKYPRRDQMETVVEEFVTKYQNCIGSQLDKDGECSLVWTINSEDTLVVFPAAAAVVVVEV